MNTGNVAVFHSPGYDPWVIPRALDFLIRNRTRWPFDRLISHTYPTRAAITP